MQDSEEAFDESQPLGEEHIESTHATDEGYHEQCRLPTFWHVIGIVEDD